MQVSGRYTGHGVFGAVALAWQLVGGVAWAEENRQPAVPVVWEVLRSQIALFSKIDTLECDYVDLGFEDDQERDAYLAGGGGGRFILKGHALIARGGRVHRYEHVFPDRERSDPKAKRWVWMAKPGLLEAGSPGRHEEFNAVTNCLDIHWEPEGEKRRFVRHTSLQPPPLFMPFQFLGYTGTLYADRAEFIPMRILLDDEEMKDAFCRLVPMRDQVDEQSGGFRIRPRFAYSMMGRDYQAHPNFTIVIREYPEFGGRKLIEGQQGMLAEVYHYENVALGKGESIPLVTRVVACRRVMAVTRLVVNQPIRAEDLALDHTLAKSIYDHTAQMQVEP